MNNHYTTIIHPVRKQLGITLTEYCVADLIRKLATDPDAPVPGWYSGKRESLADALGLSRQGLYKMLNNLFAVDAVEESANGMLRHTKKWYQLTEVDKKEVIATDDKLAKERDMQKRFSGRKRKQSLHDVTANDVNGVDTKRKQSLRGDVNGVDTKRKQSLPSKGLLIDSDLDLGMTSDAKNEFSPDTADDAAVYHVEIHEPAKRKTIVLPMSVEKQMPSNGARRDVLQPGGNAADKLAPNWNTPEKARARSADLGQELAEFFEAEYGVKVVTVQSDEPIPDTLGKAKKPPKMEFRPSVAAFSRFDLEAELDALTTDYTVAENFTMSRKVPAEKFAEYVAAFKFEARTRNDYNRRAELRGHFFNWAAKRHAAESQAKKPKPNGSLSPISRPSAEIIPPNKFQGGFKILKAHD